MEQRIERRKAAPRLDHAEIEELIERAFEHNRAKNAGLVASKLTELKDDILAEFNSAFPDGPINHRLDHQTRMDAAKERKELMTKFWGGIAAGLATFVVAGLAFIAHATWTAIKTDVKVEAKK